MTYHRLCN